ncbi:MAG: hypothetical protein PHO03_03960 [Candidatus Omnitrophica bacterium]|nr:hypothetical protein [Candidatus Omnitrophota bacterium]
MEINKFPFGAAVKFGWQKTKENFRRLIAVVLILAAINGIFSYFATGFEKTSPTRYFIIELLAYLVNMILTLGLTRIGLKIYAGENFDVSELFGSYSLFLKYFLATILYILAVCAGLVLLIIPGIIIGLRLSQYTYLIVDKGMAPVDALKASLALTKGNAFNLYLFWFVLLGVIILGILVLIVGVIVAFPVTILANIFVYRYLEARKQAAV